MRLDNVGPRTRMLAIVAGWALVAWALALLGMGGRVGTLADDPSLVHALPTPRPSPPERLGPLAQYAEIGARPLFSPDRRPRPFSLQPEGEGDADANAFDYVLSSVLIAPTLQMAILQPSGGGDSIRVKLGEAPEEAAAWRLIDLKPRSAVFAGPEGQKSLDLRVFDGTGGEEPTQVGATDAATPMTATSATSTGARPPKPPIATPVTATKPGAPKPDAAETPLSQEAQIDAIRKRIEARRAQMQQQAQQPNAPVKNP